MLLVILGVVWVVVIPSLVLTVAWLADVRRRRRGSRPDEADVPVIWLTAAIRRAAPVIPACLRRIVPGRAARRQQCREPERRTGRLGSR